MEVPTFIASLSSHASKCAGLFIMARTSFSKFPVSSDFRSWFKSLRGKKHKTKYNTGSMRDDKLQKEFQKSVT